MRRFALVLPLLAACSGKAPEQKPERSVEERVEVDPRTAEPIRTQELGTDRLNPVAKTLEWSNRSTRESATYLAGNVVIDKIFREDSDDIFGVRIRLGNRTAQVVSLEYRITFLDKNGVELVGIRNGFSPALLEPRGTVEVGDTCRVRGAVDFQLSVREPSSPK